MKDNLQYLKRMNGPGSFSASVTFRVDDEYLMNGMHTMILPPGSHVSVNKTFVFALRCYRF